MIPFLVGNNRDSISNLTSTYATTRLSLRCFPAKAVCVAVISVVQAGLPLLPPAEQSRVSSSLSLD